jgi:hypothetical protein
MKGMLENLYDAQLDPKGNTYEVLEWCTIGDEFLNDVNWFKDFFPKSLKMAEFMEAFLLLQRFNKE